MIVRGQRLEPVDAERPLAAAAHRTLFNMSVLVLTVQAAGQGITTAWRNRQRRSAGHRGASGGHGAHVLISSTHSNRDRHRADDGTERVARLEVRLRVERAELFTGRRGGRRR